MKLGEWCQFLIKLDNCVYHVVCECWDGFDGIAYGNKIYKEDREIFHAGYGKKIETLEEAHTFLRDVLTLRQMLNKE